MIVLVIITSQKLSFLLFLLIIPNDMTYLLPMYGTYMKDETESESS